MERDHELNDELIELGAVSEETKGPPQNGPDTFGGQGAGGISNDRHPRRRVVPLRAATLGG